MTRVSGLLFRFVGLIAAGLIFTATATAGKNSSTPVVVGSKNFTESVLLGELATQLLIARGIPAVHREALGGSRILWNALQRGDIDVYPEYSGTLRFELLANVVEATTAPLDKLLSGEGIAALPPFGFANNYAMGMAEPRAEGLHITRLSDLLRHAGLKIGVSNEFLHRADGWPGLKAAYQLPQLATGLDHDLAYRGLVEGDLDVIDLYTTDAEISYYNLRVLVDDRSYFPDYHALLLYRANWAADRPEVVGLLAALSGQLSEVDISRLNSLQKLDKQPAKEVAAQFLENRLKLAPADVRPQSNLRKELWITTSQQLFMVGVSMFAALLLALPLGVLAAKKPAIGRLILGLTGAVQTIPSLALLVFMIPLLGIGTLPAIVALFFYSLLPILRNTEAGLSGISHELQETAVALGLSAWARLWQIELPLASRTILAGIKTAAVINIGTATLGALIGAGGYGQPILAGIRLDDTGLILQGAIPAVLMAFVVQGLFSMVEKKLPASS
ncbi:MAG: amino acid ABC transporter permease [Gammaproteobacteria bacterium]|nr:MAG: amino acid ABC transporter permease [Gammaproteobacteria bacterium]